MKVSSIIAGAVAVIAVAVLGVFGVGLAKSYYSADGGHVIVVRNGGLFDDTSVYDVFQPNSGRQYGGLWSEEHPYPAGQRFYTVSTGVGSDQPGSISVATADGYPLSVEGTFYFELNTDKATITDFDNKFGTREFDTPDGRAYAWATDNGWRALLDNTIGKFVANSVASQFASFKCASVVPSCAFITQVAEDPTQIKVDDTGNSENIRVQIQNAITANLTTALKEQLGSNQFDYFKNVSFVLDKPTLPQALQDQVTAVQSKYSAISAANADKQAALVAAESAQQVAVKNAETEKQVAQTKAEANAITQEGYNSCQICAQIDLSKAFPPGVTVYAPGSDAGLVLPTK